MNKLFLLSVMAVCLHGPLHASENRAPLPILVRDYYSMLQSVPDAPELYSEAMEADPESCGIRRRETATGYDYEMIPGKEEQLIKGITPLQQQYYEEWLEEGEASEREEKASPLMMEMPGERKASPPREPLRDQEERHHRGASETEELVDGETSRERNSHLLSPPLERSTPPRTGEALPPFSELNISPFSSEVDDISTMTNEEGMPTTPAFSGRDWERHLNNRWLQAQDKLREAEEEMVIAKGYLDLAQRQWECRQALEEATARLNHQREQEQLAWHRHTQFLHAAHSGRIEGPNEAMPFLPLSPSLVVEHPEFQRTIQEHFFFKVQYDVAHKDYQRKYQQALLCGVDPGRTNYGTLLNETQQRVNRASRHWEDAKGELRRAEAQKNRTSLLSPPRHLQEVARTPERERRMNAPLSGERAPSTLINFPQGEASLPAPINLFPHLSDPSVLGERATSEQVIPEVVHEALAEEPPQLSLAFKELPPVAAPRETVEPQEAAVARREVSLLLQEIVTKVALSDLLAEKIWDTACSFKSLRKIVQQAKKEVLLERKKSLFKELFYAEGEATEREKWEQHQETRIRLQQEKKRELLEMENFFHPQRKLQEEGDPQESPLLFPSPLQEMRKKFLGAAQRIPHFLDQRTQYFYEKGLQSLQFCYDFIQAQRECGARADAYFNTQGRQIAAVPTQEYALKTAEIAQKLLAEKRAKRVQEARLPTQLWREDLKQACKNLSVGPSFLKKVLSFHLRKYSELEYEEAEREACLYFWKRGEYAMRRFIFWQQWIEQKWKGERKRQPRIEEIKREAQAEGLSSQETEARIREWVTADCQVQIERLKQEFAALKGGALKEEIRQAEAAKQATHEEAPAEELEREKLVQELLHDFQEGKKERRKEKFKTSPKKKK